MRNGAGVCLLGETVRQQFFGAGDPEGSTVRVGKMSCRVIGLLEPKGFSGFGQDQDNVVLMPLAAFQRRVAGNRDVETIYVSADDADADLGACRRGWRTSCASRATSRPTATTISRCAT